MRLFKVWINKLAYSQAVVKKEIAKHMLRYLISAILTTALLEFWNRTSDEDGWEELSQYQK